jgi:mono/diheme cytochrome c family protein
MTARRHRCWTLVAALCILAAARSATGQTAAKKAPARPPAKSTLSGVFTAEQANRGKNVYSSSCKNCHTAESHTGATFAKWWAGKQLSDLYSFMSTNMPKNDPGSLAPEEYADLLAYLLRMNAMPAGKVELPPDPDELQKIRISLRRPTKTSSR